MNSYEIIKKLCESRGFSISSIGSKIPNLSITGASISGWKKGSKPRPDKIKAIADYFGVPISYLTGTEDAPPPAQPPETQKNSPTEPMLNEGEKSLLDNYIYLIYKDLNTFCFYYVTNEYTPIGI